MMPARRGRSPLSSAWPRRNGFAPWPRAASAPGSPARSDVELASHDDEGRHVRARSGERLYVGERISLTITNDSDRDVYVGLLDVDTAYNVRGAERR